MSPSPSCDRAARPALLRDAKDECAPRCHQLDREVTPEELGSGESAIVGVTSQRPMDPATLDRWLATVKPGAHGVPPASVGGDSYMSAGVRAD